MRGLVANAGVEGKAEQSIEVGDVAGVAAVEQAVFEPAQPAHVALLLEGKGLRLPAPDAAHDHVALDPLFERAPPRFAGHAIPAGAQAGDGHARLGEDLHAARAVVGLAPADGGGAFELEHPAVGGVRLCSQFVHRGVADPRVTTWRAKDLADGKVDIAQAQRRPAAGEEMLQKDGKEAVVEQPQPQPALLPLADMDPPILWTLPVAVALCALTKVEGRQAKGAAVLGVVHLLREHGVDGLHRGIEGGMGQFAHRAGQRASLLRDELDDKGVEGLGHWVLIPYRLP